MAVMRRIKEQNRSERKKRDIEQIEPTLKKIGANKNKINAVKGE